MTEEKLQKVQDFLTQLEESASAREKFEALAQAGDVSGFETWAEECGCDPEFVSGLMPDDEAPEGELSDADLEGVAGGASVGWFSRSTTSFKAPIRATARVDMVATKINSAWARWQKISTTRGNF